MCRGVLLRRQLADFVIERGEGLLKHFPVGGRGRTAQIALRARTRQLQHTAALLRCPLFRRCGQAAVQLSLVSYLNGTTVPPVGYVDTPTQDTAGVTGAIPVTGWALDDFEVSGVVTSTLVESDGNWLVDSLVWSSGR